MRCGWRRGRRRREIAFFPSQTIRARQDKKKFLNFFNYAFSFLIHSPATMEGKNFGKLKGDDCKFERQRWNFCLCDCLQTEKKFCFNGWSRLESDRANHLISSNERSWLHLAYLHHHCAQMLLNSSTTPPRSCQGGFVCHHRFPLLPPSKLVNFHKLQT